MRELTLRLGDWEARVAPLGASLRGAWWRGAEVVTAYSGAENKIGGQGDVLIPFPGRVCGGRYTWDGVEHQLPLNDKDGPNAIHGFLRTQEWEVAQRSESRATFTLDFAGAQGYPFALKTGITYLLDENGLVCTYSIENASNRDAPVAAGFHPYFATGSVSIDDDELELPFESVLEFENLLPTGRVLDAAEAGFDFSSPQKIGPTRFNHCFLNPEPDCDGTVSVKLRGNGKVITVWMDASFGYVVLYSGDPLPESHRRRSLAIEPMTCASDGFNRPEWGLIRLVPGETLSGRWGVRVAVA